MGLTINDMAKEAWDNAEAHGFHERGLVPFAESIALIHSEASEALEEHRAGSPDIGYEARPNPDGSGCKPVGIASELADIVIRVGHLAVIRNIDLEKAVREKQTYNRTRPYKHNKAY